MCRKIPSVFHLLTFAPYALATIVTRFLSLLSIPGAVDTLSLYTFRYRYLSRCLVSTLSVLRRWLVNVSWRASRTWYKGRCKVEVQQEGNVSLNETHLLYGRLRSDYFGFCVLKGTPISRGVLLWGPAFIKTDRFVGTRGRKYLSASKH